MPRGVVRSNSCSMGSGRSDGSSKERLKWTKELHSLFEKAINQLGGPDRATPKGILKAMGIPGLTIFHVKSHLQKSRWKDNKKRAKKDFGKIILSSDRELWISILNEKYRMSKFIPESPHRGSRFERRSISEILPNFSATSSAQLHEALQMQKEVQKRLSDQLEVQRSLKMKIEAQGMFLERIAEEYKNKAANAKPSKPYSPVSLPSLCEESDSEIDRHEIRSATEFRSPKRVRIEDVVTQQKCKLTSPNSLSYNHNMLLLKGLNSPCWATGVGFPWSFASQSPMLPALYDSLN